MNIHLREVICTSKVCVRHRHNTETQTHCKQYAVSALVAALADAVRGGVSAPHNPFIAMHAFPHKQLSCCLYASRAHGPGEVCLMSVCALLCLVCNNRTETGSGGCQRCLSGATHSSTYGYRKRCV